MNQIFTQGIQLKGNGEIVLTCKANKWSEKYLKCSIEYFGTKEEQGNLGMADLYIATCADKEIFLCKSVYTTEGDLLLLKKFHLNWRNQLSMVLEIKTLNVL